MLTHLTLLWNNLSLARRFALAAGPVLLLGMTILGLWVSGRIVDGVVHNTAVTSLLYLDGIIAPLNDELAAEELPPAVALRALDEIFHRPDIAARIKEFRIWRQDGTLVYSGDTSQNGKVFPLSADLKAAFAGQVIADYNGTDSSENLPKPLDPSLIEIYSPIREVWSGRIIAAAEVYQSVGELDADLRDARWNTWIVVAASTLAMGALLFRIVLSGSRVIEAQQETLQKRLSDMQNMANQNRDLRLRIQAASGRASSLNERYLRRISADLHDGPAQNLAVAALRLHRIAATDDATKREVEVSEIRQVLDSAMHEIRGISRGLVLPELEAMTLDNVLERATASHEGRTKTEVTLMRNDTDGATLDQPQKICVYRFVQEGLTNAFKHGGGVGQLVSADITGGTLTVRVCDQGDAGSPKQPGSGLGLSGLQERVESLGGSFSSAANQPQGTIITMQLNLDLA